MRVESGWRRVKGVQVCEVHTTCKVYKQVEWCNVRRHDSHTNMHVDSMCIEHTHTQRCVLALHKCPNVPGLTFSRIGISVVFMLHLNTLRRPLSITYLSLQVLKYSSFLSHNYHKYCGMNGLDRLMYARMIASDYNSMLMCDGLQHYIDV